MASSLEGCVSSLRETISLLGASISTLDNGTNDLPRLTKVLQTTRHFELISESTLQAAQATIMDEITPEVDSLLDRVAKHLEKMSRREQSLVAKYELNQGRLDREDTSAAPRPRTRKPEPQANASLQSLKARQLKQRKERLELSINTLQMQAMQKERQLRKSMAAQPAPEEDDDMDDF